MCRTHICIARAERRAQREDAGTSLSDEQMRAAETRYPVDRYLVESSKKFEMVNIIDDEIWNPEPALRPEDELILRKLHDMLQSTADDLKLLSGELSKFHEPGVQVKMAPTPLDEDFNERVHIEEVVNAKFHGHRIIEHALPKLKPRNNTIDGKANKPQNNINNGAQVTAALAKRPVINRNLGISRTRIIQINDKNEDSSRKHDSVEKLNNGKVISSAPAVAYSEFCHKYVEPKVQEASKKVLQVQDMPRISIRSELREQKVLQMDIVPDSKDMNTIRSNVSVVAIQHETVPKQVPSQYNRVQDPKISVNSITVRKVSKMSTCESSGSLNNVSSDAQAKRDTQKRIITAIRNSPKTSARGCKKSTVSKKEVEKRTRLNLDGWKKKLNVVYGSSSTKNKANSRGLTKKASPKKTDVTKEPKALNNADYIPYSQLTLGGVRVSDIEREISDLPNKIDMPLSPILDKILSRENSFQKYSPRKHRKKDSPKILTTSDENLLQEVIDIEISVSETLSKNLRKKVNEPVVNSPKLSSESNKEEENESYVDDFEDEKSDHSGKSAKEISSDSEPEHNSVKSKSNEKGGFSFSDNDDASNPGPSSDARNATYTKKSNLSFKDSVDIFEFIHSVDTHDSATQSNGANKITPKETQTSPRNDRPNIQPIHNDLWPTIDPRREVEKMFELEKDLIKKLILDEYGDLLEKNINKPSTSNENKQEESKKNVAASQKNTQTSPAHVQSVMTSPRMTKTRTTSPFHPTVPVHQQTSPMILVTNEEQRSGIEVEADDISVNLSSPRFNLRLPRTSCEVLSNLTHNRPFSKISFRKEKLNNKTFTKTTASSSSSLDAGNSSSELSSLGEVKIKRKLRKRIRSISEHSSSSSKYSQDVQSAEILPLRSEGELSLGQVSKKRLNKPSDGETSFTPPKLQEF